MYAASAINEMKVLIMSIYAMHRLNKEGTVFSTSTTSYTKDYAERALPLYLADQLIEDDNGRIRRRYRLHSDKPTTIDTALSYDINCPHCGNRLRQIGRCLNAHDLGLYRCPICDKN